MLGIFAYFRERFQPLLVIPLSVATALFLVGAAMPSRYGFFVTNHITSSLSPMVQTQTALVAVLFFAFLLRTRVTDEFKDSEHDSANYPNRPVQRGVVTRGQLQILGGIALAVELACAISVAVVAGHLASVVWYLPVLGYSALTAKEFFVPRWLERHFNIYFLSHQLLFVWFALWAYQQFGASDTERKDVSYTALVAFVLLMATIEIIRKYEVRVDPQGNVVADTYLAVWGQRWTSWALALLMFSSSLVLGYALFSFVPLPLGGMAAWVVIQGARFPGVVRATVFLNFVILAVWVWYL